jgi:hypothetical protein
MVHPMARFDVVMCGSGFLVPVDEGEPVRGFIVVRRVQAADPAAAAAQAKAAVIEEESVREMLATTSTHAPDDRQPEIAVLETNPVRWWEALFSRPPKGFIFFTDEADEAGEADAEKPG